MRQHPGAQCPVRLTCNDWFLKTLVQQSWLSCAATAGLHLSTPTALTVTNAAVHGQSMGLHGVHSHRLPAWLSEAKYSQQQCPQNTHTAMTQQQTTPHDRPSTTPDSQQSPPSTQQQSSQTQSLQMPHLSHTLHTTCTQCSLHTSHCRFSIQNVTVSMLPPPISYTISTASVSATWPNRVM